MNPTERTIAIIDGKEVDRVQTFCPFLDDWPSQQVMGKPLVPSKYIFLNPASRFILDKWGMKLKKILVDPFLADSLMSKIDVAERLGFDSAWGLFEGRFMTWDSKTFALTSGSFYDIIEDGHGNVSYMYRGPAFLSPRDFDEWPYLHDNDDLAQKCFNFFEKALSKYGDKICVMGDISGGMHETLLNSLGFENLAIFIKKEPGFIQRLIDNHEDYLTKGIVAMMDAGIKVVMNGDDFAYKTGPMMNPALIDELFGPPYMRIAKIIHDRGGRFLLHSCGDNTELFDHFIKWGFDGGHAFENTSNVDINYEKKAHGDRFTIVGGIGVDYILDCALQFQRGGRCHQRDNQDVRPRRSVSFGPCPCPQRDGYGEGESYA